MKKVLLTSLAIAAFSLSNETFSQTCTQAVTAGTACPTGITESFPVGSTGTAGFSGDFTLATSGSPVSDQFLQSTANASGGSTKTLISPTFIAPSVTGLLNLRFDLSGTSANTIDNLRIIARTTTGDVVLCTGGTIVANGVNCFSFPVPVTLADRTFRFVFEFTLSNGSNKVVIFDDFGTNAAQSAAPLPVKFAQIKAAKRANGIEVSFSNLTEKDVVNYTIERSAGTGFTAIGELAATKNNDSRADYSFIDAAPLSGVNIYRIKATENSGKTLLSAVVKVDLASKAAALVIMPNPSKGAALGLQFSDLPAGRYQIRIFSAAGQVVGTEKLVHNGGSVNETFPLNNLKAGLYHVEVSGAVKLQKQFIVQ